MDIFRPLTEVTIYIRIVTLSLCGVAIGACGTFFGVSSQMPVLDQDRVVAGPEIGYRAYLLDSRGVILGGRASFLNKPQKSCCYKLRARLDAGYGLFPLLHESHWGFEATISPTIGNVAVDNQGSFAVGGTSAIAVPFRVDPSKDLWQQNSLSESIWLLVPTVNFEMLVPTYDDVELRPITAIEFSITVRYTQWPTIIP